MLRMYIERRGDNTLADVIDFEPERDLVGRADDAFYGQGYVPYYLHQYPSDLFRLRVVVSPASDWTRDPDWSAVVIGQTRHASHHVGQDAEGNWYCRECSTDRLYILSAGEVQRMCLQERTR